MKIAIFTDTYDPDINGVARTLKRFTNYLSDQNITFKIFAPKTQTGEYVSDHIHRFKSLPFFIYPECRLAFPNLLHLKSELEHFSPDLIHVATPFNIGLCGIYYAKKLNIPLVGSYHTNFDYYLQFYNLEFLSTIVWKYMNWFHRPFKKLFVPSPETLNQLKRHGFTNLEIWGRGVDCQLFHPHYDKLKVRKNYGIKRKYLLTYVGRLAPEKDLQTLLATAHILPAQISGQIQWLIIGDGPLREDLESEAPDNMLFTGYLKGQDLAEVYSASDLFVFPSPTETFGNVVLEALASGTPVVGADSGGVKNIIQEGVTGNLCTPGNAQEFANAITQLIKNDSLRTQMGFEGRKYALTQSWDTIFEHLLWSYSTVIREINEQKYA
ncbi:glycosyltransferase family 1 protein [Bacillus canaveralius]|uniref:Glycosyltransferase family 1 protein n=1 Tax=Bacillus canaveralius TaxID=1403243 RepID=A0A2N5GQS2_9BACI|nr:glycosyltransferase family 1 protein [Bacillus canaveralius]PLR85572.1 glycosyltransferase family 1 protein [Bacillus canaveralius]PLR94767.1 glycosyltransferase family 1 protein [Bacillus canaveralius]RSK54699.1 glycosyltransferase family 1 protein [Bacillus canaveralius]